MGANYSKTKKKAETMCAAILRAWLDDPVTRVSVEEGAYGDVNAVSEQLVSQLRRFFQGHPKSGSQSSNISRRRVAASERQACVHD